MKQRLNKDKTLSSNKVHRKQPDFSEYYLKKTSNWCIQVITKLHIFKTYLLVLNTTSPTFSMLIIFFFSDMHKIMTVNILTFLKLFFL